MLLITNEFLTCGGDFDKRHFALESSWVGACAKKSPKTVCLKVKPSKALVCFHICFQASKNERGSEESLPCAKIVSNLFHHGSTVI